MAAIAIAIKLDDGGPVIYAQTHVGLHGRLFKMHKFRSMVVGADRMVEQLRHLNEMSDPCSNLPTIRASPASVAFFAGQALTSCLNCGTCWLVT